MTVCIFAEDNDYFHFLADKRTSSGHTIIGNDTTKKLVEFDKFIILGSGISGWQNLLGEWLQDYLAKHNKLALNKSYVIHNLINSAFEELSLDMGEPGYECQFIVFFKNYNKAVSILTSTKTIQIMPIYGFGTVGSGEDFARVLYLAGIELEKIIPAIARVDTSISPNYDYLKIQKVSEKPTKTRKK